MPSGKGYFKPPTILIDIKPGIKVVREEIFRPVVVAKPFDGVGDALIAEANNSVYLRP